MRPNKSYWIAISVMMVTVVVALYRSGVNMMQSDSTYSPTAVTAVLARKLALPLVPENISTIPLYHVHRNIWDTIVSDHGEPALTRLIDIEDNGKVYHFEIVSNARFSNGRKVMSRDILFSLERLMAKQPGGHFNLKSMIDKIRLITESRFDIRLKEPISCFLFLLSTPEMGIVPKEACDNDGNIRNLSCGRTEPVRFS